MRSRRLPLAAPRARRARGARRDARDAAVPLARPGERSGTRSSCARRSIAARAEFADDFDREIVRLYSACRRTARRSIAASGRAVREAATTRGARPREFPQMRARVYLVNGSDARAGAAAVRPGGAHVRAASLAGVARAGARRGSPDSSAASRHADAAATGSGRPRREQRRRPASPRRSRRSSSCVTSSRDATDRRVGAGVDHHAAEARPARGHGPTADRRVRAPRTERGHRSSSTARISRTPCCRRSRRATFPSATPITYRFAVVDSTDRGKPVYARGVADGVDASIRVTRTRRCRSSRSGRSWRAARRSARGRGWTQSARSARSSAPVTTLRSTRPASRSSVSGRERRRSSSSHSGTTANDVLRVHRASTRRWQLRLQHAAGSLDAAVDAGAPPQSLAELRHSRRAGRERRADRPQRPAVGSGWPRSRWTSSRRCRTSCARR